MPTQWRPCIMQGYLEQYDETAKTQPEMVGQKLYKPLSSPRNIRLLWLLPSREPWHPIECQLRDVDEVGKVDSTLRPRYEAISYVWGRPDIRRTIAVNGQSMSVTESLDAVSKHLRWKDQVHVMWIDALCIDQPNCFEWFDEDFEQLRADIPPPFYDFPWLPAPFNWDKDHLLGEGKSVEAAIAECNGCNQCNLTVKVPFVGVSENSG